MPTVPVAEAALEITGAVKLITIDKVLVPVPPALIALIVTLEVAAAVGVPLITSVEVLIVDPVGNPVAL